MTESVSIGKAATALGVSIKTLRRLADSKLIPSTLSEGGHRRFDLDAVRAALAAGRPLLIEIAPCEEPDWSEDLFLRGLSEVDVWKRAVAHLGLAAGTEEYAVFHYAFTEMLNNAIDHSGGEKVEVRVNVDDTSIEFIVADDGVGAFQRLATSLALNDVRFAILELTKGKATSDPKHHSGQGIFFTSKIADTFTLEANGLSWRVDNDLADQAVGISPVTTGTRVTVTFSRPPARTTEQVFREFTDDDFAFALTRPSVRLAGIATTFVSRSEAKRITAGLERFSAVEMDFAGVDSVGQGFVDEVFRVWANEHPQTHIEPVGMNPAVEFMVSRGLAPSRPPSG